MNLLVKSERNLLSWSSGDYKKVVEDYALNGWRLHQVVTFNGRLHGATNELHVIFEREVE